LLFLRIHRSISNTLASAARFAFHQVEVTYEDRARPRGFPVIHMAFGAVDCRNRDNQKREGRKVLENCQKIRKTRVDRHRMRWERIVVSMSGEISNIPHGSLLGSRARGAPARARPTYSNTMRSRRAWPLVCRRLEGFPKPGCATTLSKESFVFDSLGRFTRWQYSRLPQAA